MYILIYFSSVPSMIIRDSDIYVTQLYIITRVGHCIKVIK